MSLIQRAVDRSETVQAARRALHAAAQEFDADSDAGDPKAAAAAADKLIERTATYVRQGVLREGDAAVKAARDAAKEQQEIAQLRQVMIIRRSGGRVWMRE